MANIIDNAGTSRHARIFWQREPGGKWEGGLVPQSTAHIRRNIAQALDTGKAPKHAYRIEPAEALNPMSEEAKEKLRTRQAELKSQEEAE